MTPIGSSGPPYSAPAYPPDPVSPQAGAAAPRTPGTDPALGTAAPASAGARPGTRNGLAVAAAAVPVATPVVGGILGVVLGTVALRQVRRARRTGAPQRGTALAITGIVLGLLVTAAWVAGTWYVVWAVQLSDRGEDNADPADVTEPVEILFVDVNPGHCLELPTFGAARVTIMPCDVPHDAELLAMLPVQLGPDGGYPGQSSMQREGNARCEATLAALPPTSAGLFRPFALAPPEGMWNDDHREVWCFVTSRHGPVTGRIADDDVALAD
ncbi:DUF4190 domain-containing protein [Sanguibacter sp. 25GB23B1]|uniref:DUF4190 domain-containing protein n=1 Tax=unclassified Sanguibacter TaxID=2645534 RepID=UPI0032AF7E6F